MNTSLVVDWNQCGFLCLHMFRMTPARGLFERPEAVFQEKSWICSKRRQIRQQDGFTCDTSYQLCLLTEGNTTAAESWFNLHLSRQRWENAHPGICSSQKQSRKDDTCYTKLLQFREINCGTHFWQYCDLCPSITLQRQLPSVLSLLISCAISSAGEGTKWIQHEGEVRLFISRAENEFSFLDSVGSGSSGLHLIRLLSSPPPTITNESQVSIYKYKHVD